MAAVYPALLSLVLTALTLTSYHRYSSREQATSGSVNKERGDRKNLTVYAMAVGQGDGNIILCPNGRDIVIVDMGSTQQYANQSYGGHLLKKFGASKNNNTSIHVVITHPDKDHYNFLPESFREDDELIKLVKEVILGGSYEDYKEKDWFQRRLRDVPRHIPIYTVNNGDECFGNDNCSWTPVSTIKKTKKPASDGRWQFCGDSVNITVLGANICGNKCNKEDTNGRSIILKLVYKEWSLFLSGDFEGKPQQEKLMKNWSQSVLHSTYYKVAHHGAWSASRNGPNPIVPKLLRAISPRRAYVSSAHPKVSAYSHPKCEVFDNLRDLVDETNSQNDIRLACCNKELRNLSNTNRCVTDHRSGYAIYQTCRYYDYGSRCQICQDIEITTDGYNDYTVYRSVPTEFVEADRKKTNCRKPQQILKYLMQRHN